ncbi:MAG TPA: DUF58 domain-containing protein [Vicinamibacterales bacterium]|nr:DUF58 domain-containing protein [Vicinamibacterales bacterium]
MTGTRLSPPPVSAGVEPSGRLALGLGPRTFVLLAAGLLWLVPAWHDRRAILGLLLWDTAVLAAVLLDVRRMPSPRDLTSTRRWPGPLTLGVPGQVSLDIRNGGAVAIDVRATDHVPGALRIELPDMRCPVRSRGTAEASYTIEPAARGDAVVGPAVLSWLSPWRLAERRGIARLVQTVRVYPDLSEGRRESLYLIRSRQVVIEKRRARRLGLGREFESLRDHQPGDEPRDICWTAAARRGRLVTKVYQPERSQAVWILVDAGRLQRARAGRHTMLDHAVTGALTLAQVAMASGDKVGLLAYGRRPQHRLAPSRGGMHLRALTEALASVRGEASEADHAGAAAELLRLQKRRGLIVWLTEVAETAGTPDVIEHTMTLVPRHVVLFAVMRHPDIPALAAAAPRDSREMYRVMAAQEVMERREALLLTLRQRGALVVEASPAELGSGLIDRYLEVKERALL